MKIGFWRHQSCTVLDARWFGNHIAEEVAASGVRGSGVRLWVRMCEEGGKGKFEIGIFAIVTVCSEFLRNLSYQSTWWLLLHGDYHYVIPRAHVPGLDGKRSDDNWLRPPVDDFPSTHFDSFPHLNLQMGLHRLKRILSTSKKRPGRSCSWVLRTSVCSLIFIAYY